jgi:hypothetical protein
MPSGSEILPTMNIRILDLMENLSSRKRIAGEREDWWCGGLVGMFGVNGACIRRRPITDSCDYLRDAAENHCINNLI